MFAKRFQYFTQHKVDEWSGLPCFRAISDSVIVSLLVRIDHIFYGQMFKYRVKPTQYQRLPKSSCTTIAITERMNKLKFIMEYARANEKMVFRILQPIEQICYKHRYSVSWWCQM